MNTAAASSTGDPHPACAPIGKGVWFSFTSTAAGRLSIRTDWSDFDTALAVYTGTCNAIGSVYACNDDDEDTWDTSARVSIDVVEGKEYRLLVGGHDGAIGNLQITTTMLPLE